MFPVSLPNGNPVLLDSTMKVVEEREVIYSKFGEHTRLELENEGEELAVFFTSMNDGSYISSLSLFLNSEEETRLVQELEALGIDVTYVQELPDWI